LQFNVSKEAMGRAYVNYHGEALALVVVRDGVVQRFYKNLHFKPTIQNRRGATVEQSSFFHDASHRLHEPSRWSECDPETWLTLDRRNNRLVLSEQVYLQQDGYAMVLLKVEMLNDEDEDEEEAPRPRFGFNRY
jgi:hypothetical protein